jgi:glutathione S-transferase
MITVFTFNNLPPAAKGLSRDLRAVWALEESGLPYRIHELDGVRGDQRSAEYTQVNPFGIAPSIEDDDLKLFESAAIILYVAEKAGKLLPSDARERARATQWAFAALNTVEPPMAEVFAIDRVFADQAWAKERRPARYEAAQKRLAALDRELANRPYLMGQEFSAPDILMTTVLRYIQHTDLLNAAPNVLAYKTRCEKRPAWEKTLSNQEKILASTRVAASSR